MIGQGVEPQRVSLSHSISSQGSEVMLEHHKLVCPWRHKRQWLTRCAPGEDALRQLWTNNQTRRLRP